MNFEEPIINKTVVVAGSTGSGKTQLIHCFKYSPDLEDYQDPKQAVDVGTEQTYHVNFRFNHENKSYNVSIIDNRGSGDVINELNTGIRTYMEKNFLFTDVILICIENCRMKQEIKTLYESMFRNFSQQGKEHVSVIVTHCEGLTEEAKQKIKTYVSDKLKFPEERIYCLGSRLETDIVPKLHKLNKDWIKECQIILRDIIVTSHPTRTKQLFSTNCRLL